MNSKSFTGSIFLLLFSFFAVQFSMAQDHAVIPLYKGMAPGSENWKYAEKTSTKNMLNINLVYNVSMPTLTVFLPDKNIANGCSVIIAPGGGFHDLTIDREGYEVAKFLNANGITAFVLKYRLLESKTDDPFKEMLPTLMGDRKKMNDEMAPVIPLAMNDGIEAVRYVRSHAQEFHIEKNRIGFMGFSAGATVTMSVVYNADSASRPDFIVQFYTYGAGVITNKIPTQKIPAFIVVAGDDQFGLTPNSIDIYNVWKSANQPAELHIYEKGGHGFGVGKQNLPVDHWPEVFMEWMKSHGYAAKQG